MLASRNSPIFPRRFFAKKDSHSRASHHDNTSALGVCARILAEVVIFSARFRAEGNAQEEAGSTAEANSLTNAGAMAGTLNICGKHRLRDWRTNKNVYRSCDDAVLWAHSTMWR